MARTLGVVLLGTALTVASAQVAPTRASAQCTGAACTQVRPDGKGILGLGLLGAELGLFIPAIVQNAAHTNEWWPYLVFPLLGAAGGAVGGYFMEQETQSSPEIDVAFFVAGMVLIVPAIVGTLALAAYTPPAETVEADQDMVVDDQRDDSVEAIQDDTQTTAPADAPVSDPTGDSSATQSRRETGGGSPLAMGLAGGTGLLRFDGTSHQVLLGVPAIGATGTYTAEEITRLHLTQTYDVHVPVVSATF